MDRKRGNARPARMKEQEWICTGARLSEKRGKLALAFLTPEGEKIFLPKTNIGKRFFPGGKYTVAYAKGEGASLGSAQYNGRVGPEDGRLLGWEVEHNAAVAAVEMERVQSKEAQATAVKEALKAIIQEGRRTNAAGKSALKLHVLATLDRAWRFD